MGIADPQAALEQLRESRDLLVLAERALQAGRPLTGQARCSTLQPLIIQIS